MEDDFSAGRDSEADDSFDGNFDRQHPGFDRRRRRDEGPPPYVMVGALQCPLARAVPEPTIPPPIWGAARDPGRRVAAAQGACAWACHASGACDIDSGARDICDRDTVGLQIDAADPATHSTSGGAA